MLHQAESIGLQLAEERDAAGGPVLEEEETVLHKFEGLQLLIGAGADQGEGTLYITEWRIIWLSAANPRLGYSVDFPAITMHAVASAEPGGADGADSSAATRAAAPARPCLYLQLDAGEEGEGGGLAGGSASSSEEEGEGEGEAELLPELRLVPADASQLEPLFQAFCDGAERNPDYSDEEEEEGQGGGVFFDQDEVLAGAAAAALGVGDVEELVGEDPGRFEDADPEGDAFEEFEGQQRRPAAQQQPNGGC